MSTTLLKAPRNSRHVQISKNEEGNRLVTNKESNGRVRSDCLFIYNTVLEKLRDPLSDIRPEGALSNAHAAPHDILPKLDRTPGTYTDNRQREQIEARIDAKNEEMRTEFLKDFLVLDSAGVCKLAGLKGTNTSQTVNTWLQKGRILGLLLQGKNAYPVFQFDADGQPFTLMEPVLAALPKSFTAWQSAFWFVSPKEALDGKTPAEAVQEAARDNRAVAAARAADDLVAAARAADDLVAG